MEVVDLIEMLKGIDMEKYPRPVVVELRDGKLTKGIEVTGARWGVEGEYEHALILDTLPLGVTPLTDKD